ncbi:hypothetical protein [Mycobacterium kyogaense]|uniref:hypothetical protein n=1 Tax=Mycobacterium kyogaense TaxID=2212479 RepID=UPI000DACBDAB|nr:hypothetical protein [Mycobacterium kyogaense]
MSDYLAALGIMLLCLSPLFIPIAVHVVDWAGRFSRRRHVMPSGATRASGVSEPGAAQDHRQTSPIDRRRRVLTSRHRNEVAGETHRS